MANPTKSARPVADHMARPPETHAQTQPVEQVISPSHNTTEPYGPSSDQASKLTRAKPPGAKPAGAAPGRPKRRA